MEGGGGGLKAGRGRGLIAGRGGLTEELDCDYV